MGVAVGVQARPRHRLAEVDVDDAGAVPGPFGLVGGEADRPGRGVAEEHLRHRAVVGGDGVRTPRSGVDGLPGGAGGDRGGGDAGLVLASTSPGPVSDGVPDRPGADHDHVIRARGLSIGRNRPRRIVKKDGEAGAGPYPAGSASPGGGT
jgi:hypothetical protein